MTSPNDIRLAAMDLLARREHSLAELQRKLRRRFADEEQVERQLQRLREENLQSDERYAGSYVRQRSARGYGPLRIRQEMLDRGLSEAAIGQAFAAEEVDWAALAVEVYHKKFGGQRVPQPGRADRREAARRIRFMQYRGFAADHYRQLVDD